MELIWYIPTNQTKWNHQIKLHVWKWSFLLMFKSQENQKNLFEIPNMCKSFILLNHGFSQWLSPVKPLEITASCARFSPATLCARLGFCGPRPGLGPGWCRPRPAAAVVPGEPWRDGGHGEDGGGDQERRSNTVDIDRTILNIWLCIYIYMYICT